MNENNWQKESMTTVKLWGAIFWDLLSNKEKEVFMEKHLKQATSNDTDNLLVLCLLAVTGEVSGVWDFTGRQRNL